MSETIILIMTSSSTRNTEPRGGRVAVMRSVLPRQITDVSKYRLRVQRLHSEGYDSCANCSLGRREGKSKTRHNVQVSQWVPEQERGAARKCSFRSRVDIGLKCCGWLIRR